MLVGERVKIMTGSFQNDMTSIESRDDVLTLMIHLGYLAYNVKEKSVFIPNEEIRQEFVFAVIKSKHKEMVKLIRIMDNLLEQTLRMNEEAVAVAIEKAHKFMSSPIKYNNEESLRSTIRFAYLSCLENFTKNEELPSGHGYVDITFVPKPGSIMPIILIELKIKVQKVRLNG